MILGAHYAAGQLKFPAITIWLFYCFKGMHKVLTYLSFYGSSYLCPLRSRANVQHVSWKQVCRESKPAPLFCESSNEGAVRRIVSKHEDKVKIYAQNRTNPLKMCWRVRTRQTVWGTPTATVCLPLLHSSQCLSTTQTTPADQLHASLPSVSRLTLLHFVPACLSGSDPVCSCPGKSASLLSQTSRIGLLSTSLRSVPVSNQLSPPDSGEKPDRLLSPTTITCLRPSWFSSGGSRSAGVVWLAQSELACYAFQTSTRVNQ